MRPFELDNEPIGHARKTMRHRCARRSLIIHNQALWPASRNHVDASGCRPRWARGITVLNKGSATPARKENPSALPGVTAPSEHKKEHQP